MFLSLSPSIDRGACRYVILVRYRWDSLRHNATAMGKPWPLHNTKEEEFESFAVAYNVSGIHSFTEERKKPDGHGHAFSSVQMTLASFRAELFPSADHQSD